VPSDCGSRQLEGVKADGVFIGADLDFAEARRVQSCRQVVRIDWNVSVVVVQGTQVRTVEAVLADKDATWPQHTMDLGQEFILPFDARNVVEHRQTHSTGEPLGGQVHACCVGAQHLNIGASEPRGQGTGQIRVNLDRGEPGD
jgi:hypothetical protein